MSQRHYTGPTPSRRPSWLGSGLAWLLATAVVVLQILYPIVDDVDRPELAVATVVVFYLASLVHATVHRGLAGFGLVGIVVPAIALAAEALAVRTGIPFGDYEYTDVLGWQIWDVPVVVPLAWAMMAYPAYAAATKLATRRWYVAVVGAWALMTWDLFLDPMMVELGAWTWNDDGLALGSIPEVPLQNFLGWFVVGLVVTWVLTWLPRTHATIAQPITLFLWTYVSSILAFVFFFDRVEVAVVGGIAMGFVAIPLLWRLWDYRG
jgi:putative membrane protein